MVNTIATALHIVLITPRKVSSCIRNLTWSDHKINLQNSSVFVVVINQYWWYSREVPQTLGSRRCQDQVNRIDRHTGQNLHYRIISVYLFQRTNVQNYFCVWSWDRKMLSRPGPIPRPHPKIWKGPGVTWLAKISVCAVFVRRRRRPLPITEFLTRESYRLVPRPFGNGNKANL